MAMSTPEASPVNPRLSVAELSAFLDDAFPAAARPALGQVVLIAPFHVQTRLDATTDMLRPGGIVSGPTLMGMADVAAYAVVLAHIGPVPMAVTHTLNMVFLRACEPALVHAVARILKLGRRLATIDVRLWQRVETNLVAQATVGYAMPG